MGSDQNVEGMGFAISINEVKDIIKSLMDYGKIPRPSLGIYGQSVVSEKNSIKGVYVKEVIPGSGAMAAGIKPTDIIMELDNKKVSRFEDIADILDKHKVGDSISCKILRNKKAVQINIVLLEVNNKDK
jgi:serine protease Do